MALHMATKEEDDYRVTTLPLMVKTHEMKDRGDTEPSMILRTLCFCFLPLTLSVQDCNSWTRWSGIQLRTKQRNQAMTNKYSHHLRKMEQIFLKSPPHGAVFN